MNIEQNSNRSVYNTF